VLLTAAVRAVRPKAFARLETMCSDSGSTNALGWRNDLPVLIGHDVILREPAAQDLTALVAILSQPDSSRFDLDAAVSDVQVRRLIETARRDRMAARGFSYVVTVPGARTVVGLFQVRRLDPAFEGAEWECSLLHSSRGTGIFIEAARLVGSFLFGSVGIHRLEARVAVDNGRANGALRKLGAVHEGILRRSMRRGSTYVDQALWAVLKEDWGHQWAPAAPPVH